MAATPSLEEYRTGFGGRETEAGRQSKIQLLVSVRDVEEAILAQTAGADWIDIKEPQHGPLGCPSVETVESIAQALDIDTKISVALGELTDLDSRDARRHLAIERISLFKIGLSCSAGEAWENELRGLKCHTSKDVIPTIYADWQNAQAPSPDSVLELAREVSSSAVLIDTWNKQNKSVFQITDVDDLRGWIEGIQGLGAVAALAGGICLDEISLCRTLRPNLVGMRGGLTANGRLGRLQPALVTMARNLLIL